MMYGGKFKDFHIVGNCGGFLIKFWFLGFIFLNREFCDKILIFSDLANYGYKSQMKYKYLFVFLYVQI
jgi:hypothetical protein